VPVVPDVRQRRPVDAFETLREIGLRPVLLGVPTIKSEGNTGYRVAAQEPPAETEVGVATPVCLALRPYLLSFGPIDGPPIAGAGTTAPHVVGVELETAIRQVTDLGLIAVVFQPERAVTELEIARQEPKAGETTSFREVAMWLD
jgi:beta-lactam-binding protein with PASTA domain